MSESVPHDPDVRIRVLVGTEEVEGKERFPLCLQLTLRIARSMRDQLVKKLAPYETPPPEPDVSIARKDD